MRLCIFAIFIGLAYNGSSQVVVDPAYRYRAHELPAGDWQCEQFEVFAKEMVILPFHGGLFVPGTGQWLLPPDTTFVIRGITRAAGDSMLYFSSIGRNRSRIFRLDMRRGHEELRSVTDMPRQRNLLSADPTGDTLMIASFDGLSTLLSLAVAGSLVPLGKLEGTPVNSCAVLGTEALLFSTAGGVFMWKPGNGTKLLFKVEQLVESLAMSSNGTIYLSTTEGVCAVTKNKGLQPVMMGGHGMLKLFGNVLYVLDDEHDKLFELELM